MDKVKIKWTEQINSDRTHLPTHQIWTLLSEDMVVLNPWGIGLHNIGTVLVQDTKMFLHREIVYISIN